MKKYRNYKVESAPSPTFPHMVSVTLKNGVVKKFVTAEKAELWIEEQIALKAINRDSASIHIQCSVCNLSSFL